MANYTKIVDYAAKDALNTGDPAKLIKGTEIGAEYDAIATAIATKANSASPVFTGISSFAVGAVGAPSIYMTGYATTGWYNIGANNWGFAVSGAKVLDIASTGLSVTGVSSASGFQCTSNSTNSAGSGVELLGGATGTVQAYNRTGGAYINLALDGLTTSLKASGSNIAVATSTGLAVTGAISATTTIKTGGYTVATLPAGTVGMRAYVTDATAPTYNGALTGGGAVTVPVFYNGTAWVSA